MTLLDETKYLMKQYKVLPEKSKGQNFLISDEILEKIINESQLKENENILEIGPGLGTLTKKLLEKNVNLNVIELDEKFIQILKILSKNNPFKIVEGDILKINLMEKLDLEFLNNYKIVANLPYNITSRFLRIFLESQHKPKKMVLMLQKEVAERIINKDGKWSKLSVMCNFYSEPKYLFTVSKDCFHPIPKVDSAVISFDLRGRQPSRSNFWQIVRVGFSSKRRTLINNLKTGLKLERSELENILSKMKLDLNIRAEKLNIEDWIKLSEML